MPLHHFIVPGRARVGIPDGSKASLFHQIGEANASAEVIQDQYSTDTSAPTHDFRKSRGTYAAPVDAAIGDRVIDIRCLKRAGTLGFAFGGAYRAYIDTVAGGLVANQNPPSKLVFETNLLNASSTEQAGLWSTGQWSIGAGLYAAGLAANLDLFHVGANGTAAVRVQRSTTDAVAPIFRFYKTRGTISVPLKVEADDLTGSLGWRVHDGTNADQLTAQISGAVDAATVNGQRPASRLEFYTNLNNAAQVKQMTLDRAGRLGIGIVPVTTAAKLALLQLVESGLSGIYLGNTANAAANVLDWYEEGTWTPTILINSSAVGIAYSIQTGFYTRIGNLVFCTFSIVLSNKGASVGNVEVAGPFNVVNSVRDGGYLTQCTANTALAQMWTLKANATNLFGVVKWNGPTQTNPVTGAELGNSSRLEGTLIYKVA